MPNNPIVEYVVQRYIKINCKKAISVEKNCMKTLWVYNEMLLLTVVQENSAADWLVREQWV